MAFTGSSMSTSFKVEVFNGIHAFGTSVIRAATTPDVLKIALFTSAATLTAATTGYVSTNEVAAGGGYSTGGNTLTAAAPTSTGTTAFADFTDSTWGASTITARGAQIYNSSQSSKSIAVLDFGADKSSSGGNFTIQFPVADATNAILRIA
jgi:hypothetical protein